MVTVPPVTPPAPVAPVTAVPTVTVPAQIVAAEAIVEALRQNVLLPVTTVQPQPAQQLLLQTPQGAVTIQLPPGPNGQPLTEAQIQTLASFKNLQLQLPALAAGTLSSTSSLPGMPNAAQLLISLPEWQQVLRAGSPALSATSLSAQPLTGPLRLTATILPPAIATAYGVPQNVPAPAQSTTTPVQSLLTHMATSSATLTTEIPHTPLSGTTTTPPLFNLSVVINDDPAQPLASPPPGSQQVSAQLAGRTPGGDLLLHIDTSGETLLVPQAQLGDRVAALQPGQKIALTVLPATPDTFAPPTADMDPTAPSLPALNHTLKEVLQTLAMALPDTITQLESQSVARIGTPHLSGTMLFMLAALGTAVSTPAAKQQPILHKDLIEALKQASSHGGELATRLTAELRSLVTLTTDQQGYEWRSTPFPTHINDGLLSPLHLYVQQRQDQSSRDGGDTTPSSSRDKQTRFVLDLHFTRLGHTQLEGLSKPKALDLLLRTDNALPQPLQQELINRYTDILSATGLTGTLAFNRGNWLQFASTHQQRDA